MVQYAVQDQKYKVTIWYDRGYNGREERIMTSTSGIDRYCSDRYCSYDSIDTALDKYCDTATDLKLYGIGLAEYPIDALSRYTVLRSVYVQSAKILPGTSVGLLSSNTVEVLRLYLVYDIEGIGLLPNLSTLSIKYSTLDRLPDLRGCPLLKYLEIKHCVFTEQSVADLNEQLLSYVRTGIRLTAYNNRDMDCIHMVDYRWDQ